MKTNAATVQYLPLLHRNSAIRERHSHLYRYRPAAENDTAHVIPVVHSSQHVNASQPSSPACIPTTGDPGTATAFVAPGTCKDLLIYYSDLCVSFAVTCARPSGIGRQQSGRDMTNIVAFSHQSGDRDETTGEYRKYPVFCLNICFTTYRHGLTPEIACHDVTKNVHWCMRPGVPYGETRVC